LLQQSPSGREQLLRSAGRGVLGAEFMLRSMLPNVLRSTQLLPAGHDVQNGMRPGDQLSHVVFLGTGLQLSHELLLRSLHRSINASFDAGDLVSIAIEMQRGRELCPTLRSGNQLSPGQLLGSRDELRNTWCPGSAADCNGKPRQWSADDHTAGSADEHRTDA
jgi:hypothetical protein